MISYGSQFKEEIINGILEAASAIQSTYGPDGNVVFVKSKYGGTKFTKDGFSVALALEDINNDSYSAHDIGVKMVVECSKRINQICGDSTTTVVVLFKELINQVRNLNLKSEDIKKFCLDIDKDVESICNYLKENSKSIESLDELIKVARTSANDEELGKFIAELVWEVKKNKIKVVQSRSNKTYSTVIEGIQFPVRTPSYTLRNHLVHPNVFITTRAITTWDQIKPVIDKCVEDKNLELLIVCEDIIPAVYSIIESFQEKGAINVSLVKAPYTNKEKELFLKSIAKICKTKVNSYSSEIADFVKDVPMGVVDEISFTNGADDDNSLYLIPSDNEVVTEVIKELNDLPAYTDYEKFCRDEVLGVISSKVGILNLYADSESEFKEIRDRVDDCINTCKNSLEYGMSDGGGTAYKKASKVASLPCIKDTLLSPSRILGGTNGKVYDSTFSLINCIKVSTSVLKQYLKLNYAVVNVTESLL